MFMQQTIFAAVSGWLRGVASRCPIAGGTSAWMARGAFVPVHVRYRFALSGSVYVREPAREAANVPSFHRFTAEPVARSGLAGSEWRVAEIEGRDGAGGGTLRFTVTSVRGKAACNTFFGSFREAGKSIKIDGINSTRMHCNGQMQLERQFLAALSKALGRA